MGGLMRLVSMTSALILGAASMPAHAVTHSFTWTPSVDNEWLEVRIDGLTREDSIRVEGLLSWDYSWGGCIDGHCYSEKGFPNTFQILLDPGEVQIHHEWLNWIGVHLLRMPDYAILSGLWRTANYFDPSCPTKRSQSCTWYYNIVDKSGSLSIVSSAPGIEISVRTFPFIGPPLPEPATWAMLVAGFGLVGGALRRKARMTPAAG